MEITVIIEKNEGELWGRIEGIGNFLPVVVGNTKAEVSTALKVLIDDYKINEGKDDKEWLAIKVENVVFTFSYDVQSFFEEFDFLNQTKIAQLAGINPTLLRQYASGVKHPSKEQAIKIEVAIHKLAHDLESVSVYAE